MNQGDMSNMGLSKLIEECGELIQVCGKRLAMMDSDNHWDGSNLRERMQEEMGDVMGAIRFVMHKFNLDKHEVLNRSVRKELTFLYWDNGGKAVKPLPEELQEAQQR